MDEETEEQFDEIAEWIFKIIEYCEELQEKIKLLYSKMSNQNKLINEQYDELNRRFANNIKKE